MSDERNEPQIEHVSSIASERESVFEADTAQLTTEASHVPLRLMERLPKLANGETVELNDHAVIAIDVVNSAEIHNISPEISMLLTEFLVEYRQRLALLTEQSEYSNRLNFIKSAGDEALFVLEYTQPRDFILATLLRLEGQITFNEVLEDERFSQLRHYYQRIESLHGGEEIKPATHVKIGIAIPGNDPEYNCALKVLDFSGGMDVAIVGRAAVAKKWARGTSEAELGSVGTDGIYTGQLNIVLADVLKLWNKNVTDVDILGNLNATLSELRLMRDELQAMAKKVATAHLSTKDEAQRLLLLKATPHTIEITKRLQPQIEVNRSGEVISENGGIAFMNLGGIGEMRRILEHNLTQVPPRLRSKVLAEFVAESYEIATQECNALLKQSGWSLKETEHIMDIVTQVEDGSNRVQEKKAIAGGSLIMIATRGIFTQPNALDEVGINGLREVINRVKSTQFKNQLQQKATELLERYSITGVDSDKITQELDEVSLDIGIGIADLDEPPTINPKTGVSRPSVYAIYNDNRTTPIYQNGLLLGGNATSLAARRTFVNVDIEGSFISMDPSTAQRLRLANAVTNTSKRLKGFSNKSDMAVFTVK